MIRLFLILVISFYPNAGFPQHEITDSLLEGAKAGDAVKVRSALSTGINPNTVFSVGGQTALTIATYFRHPEVIQLLVEEGADLDLYALNGANAILLASDQGFVEMIDTLARLGAELDDVYFEGYGPLGVAVERDILESAIALIGHGADPNFIDKNGYSPLARAAGTGKTRFVTLFFDGGARVNANKGMAFGYSIGQGFPNVTRIFIERGVEVDQVLRDGYSPLTLAAVTGNVQTTRMLLDAEADPNKHDGNRNTAIAIAATEESFEIVELLLANGADVDGRNSEGDTPLIIAAARQDMPMIELLVFHCADRNLPNKKGETARTWAAYHGNKALAEKIREKCDSG